MGDVSFEKHKAHNKLSFSKTAALCAFVLLPSAKRRKYFQLGGHVNNSCHRLYSICKSSGFSSLKEICYAFCTFVLSPLLELLELVTKGLVLWIIKQLQH